VVVRQLLAVPLLPPALRKKRPRKKRKKRRRSRMRIWASVCSTKLVHTIAETKDSSGQWMLLGYEPRLQRAKSRQAGGSIQHIYSYSRVRIIVF
jgi:hypothetical protein